MNGTTLKKHRNSSIRWNGITFRLRFFDPIHEDDEHVWIECEPKTGRPTLRVYKCPADSLAVADSELIGSLEELVIIHSLTDALFSTRKMATCGVHDQVSSVEIRDAVLRHCRGDWGDVSPEDAAANNEALAEGGQVLGSYKSTSGVVFWVVTGAGHEVTTAMLPEEY